MKKLLASAAILVGMACLTGQAQAVPMIDVVQAPTGYFTPTDADKLNSPYYRGAGEDWGWTHGALAAGFTSATLRISAYDVDYSSGERDEIFAKDNRSLVSLGFLGGANNAWAFTDFVLGANFFDDIANGLEIFMDIDSTNAFWYVSLAKSVITVDGATTPGPDPELPEAGTLGLFGLGLVGLGLAARRRKLA
jgi:hypothetical protein